MKTARTAKTLPAVGHEEAFSQPTELTALIDKEIIAAVRAGTWYAWFSICVCVGRVEGVL